MQLGRSSTIKKIFKSSNYNGTSREDDWAIVRLSESLGLEYGYVEVLKTSAVEILAMPKKFFAAHYSDSFEKGLKLSLQHGCFFTGHKSELNYVLHNCDSSRGSSGSSIFYLENQARPETAKVIAVHVGEYRNGGDKSLLSIDYSDSVANIALPSNTFMEGLTTALNEEQD